jgi:hypothetical protein
MVAYKVVVEFFVDFNSRRLRRWWWWLYDGWMDFSVVCCCFWREIIFQFHWLFWESSWLYDAHNNTIIRRSTKPRLRLFKYLHFLRNCRFVGFQTRDFQMIWTETELMRCRNQKLKSNVGAVEEVSSFYSKLTIIYLSHVQIYVNWDNSKNDIKMRTIKKLTDFSKIHSFKFFYTVLSRHVHSPQNITFTECPFTSQLYLILWELYKNTIVTFTILISTEIFSSASILYEQQILLCLFVIFHLCWKFTISANENDQKLIQINNNNYQLIKKFRTHVG